MMAETGDPLYERLATMFSREMNIDVPSPDTDLIATGRLDSLGLVELLFKLEQKFEIHVEISDLEFDHFRSMASIAAFVRSRANDVTSAAD